MIKNPIMRVLALALCVLLSTKFANAHALPGSELTLTEQPTNTLSLKLSFALEDLIIAAPSLFSLDGAQIDEPLKGNVLNKLNDYLHSHMALISDAQALPVTLNHAEINLVHNSHVGFYRSMVIELSAPFNNQSELFPMSLHYDVIMHEVRNHRAIVYWQKSDSVLVKLTSFSYQKPQGEPVGYKLELE
ncbi:hypothetical protein [Pseudoalteromonas sp. SG43-5]|jgi:hypothetical protein|uniref:hypothetical protein n=1 Tax=Pseudoalteromonas sp. SG43-5 TaxID=2760968 RepID=UPI0015FF638F|nr:hypothetical protein [Pseudoalteromonas sp. SG43-5]MBB1454450.1 hypothetical protein [Pseudoalteromonas sp. SG43-5]|tara:strand:- start:293 stop:859 length:567 start_codon:yes stop_codon:yes gene_type:complete